MPMPEMEGLPLPPFLRSEWSTERYRPQFAKEGTVPWILQIPRFDDICKVVSLRAGQQIIVALIMLPPPILFIINCYMEISLGCLGMPSQQEVITIYE